MTDQDDMMRHVNRPDPDLRTQDGRGAIREAFPQHVQTHWDGCSLHHVRCALYRALRVIDEMEKEIRTWETADYVE